MERINIMTSCDDGIAQYILPQLASIGTNLNTYDVHFFLFHSRISSEKIDLIREYSKSFSNISFNEIFIENTEPYELLLSNAGAWPHEAYFSLDCHKYLSDDIQRILYIDAGDVIIEGDIAEYYFDDFEDCSLIATAILYADSPNGPRPFNKDDLGNPMLLSCIKRGIFNSGSYVINLTKLRMDKLTIDDFIYVSNVLQSNFRPEEEKAAYIGDQGLLSVAFVGDIKFFAYPEITDTFYMPYDFGLYFFSNSTSLQYVPKVIHYVGMYKPWSARFSVDEMAKYNFNLDVSGEKAPFYLNFKQVEFFEKWWQYCEMTPIYEEANRTASIYARALEDYFLPLCKKYNDLLKN